MERQEHVIAPWENPVRVSLREGKPVVDITISTTNVEIAAQAAEMGFDFLWIEMEHTPITLEIAPNMSLRPAATCALAQNVPSSGPEAADLCR